jgi:hypothetical protein
MIGRDVPDPLSQLHRLIARGVPPFAIELLPQHAALVDALIAQYGRLSVARERLDRRQGTSHLYQNRAMVARALQRLAAAGQRLTPARLRELGEEMLIKAAYAHFGSFRNARREAGMSAPPRPPRRRPPPSLSREATIEVIAERQNIPVGRRSPLTSEQRRSIAHYFGSLSEAKAALGLPHQRWDAERVVDALTDRLAAGLRIDGKSILEDRRADLWNAVVRHIGSFVEARRRAESMLRFRRATAKVAARQVRRTSAR